MSVGTPISQYEKAQSIPSGTTYIVDMGDGSGTKGVTQEVLTKEVGKGLQIGDTKELQTENKESLVGAINEVARSGGGSSVDILDTKEEIEANTATGKAAGATAVKEMFNALNDNLGGCTFGITSDGKPGWKDGADTVHPFSSFRGVELICTVQARFYNSNIPNGRDTFTGTVKIIIDSNGNTTLPNEIALNRSGSAILTPTGVYFKITNVTVNFLS